MTSSLSSKKERLMGVEPKIGVVGNLPEWMMKISWKTPNAIVNMNKGTSDQIPQQKWCILTIWLFPRIMVPQNGWFIIYKVIMEKPYLKWMILGAHPYFWKHPHSNVRWAKWWSNSPKKKNKNSGGKKNRQLVMPKFFGCFRIFENLSDL